MSYYLIYTKLNSVYVLLLIYITYIIDMLKIY